MKPEVLPIPAAACMRQAASTKADGAKDIRIIRTFFLRGPGIWTYRPMLEAWVDIGELEDFPSNTLPGFNERLTAWLPTLIEHRCGIGERGGFLQRLRDGTWCAHILEHVMIELQNLAGIPTGFGKAREMSQRALYKVVVRTPHEATGHAALYAARELLLAAIHDRPYDVGAAVAQLRAVAAACALDAASEQIVQAAESRRIPVIRLEGSKLVQLGYGARQKRVLGGVVAGVGAIAQDIADDWPLAAGLLRAAGVPVADEDEAPAQGGNRFRLLVVGQRVAAAVCADAPHEDLAARLHPAIADLAALAARVIGLETACIVLHAEDLARAPEAQQAAVAGFELRPELSAQGAQAIVDHFFPVPAHSRIPVVGITGSHGKTAVARLLAHLLACAGRRTGLACSEGLFVGTRRIAEGDAANWEGARRVLRNPNIDAAVIENGHRSIVGEGLGYDRCQVGVVTGLGERDTLPEFDINDAERMVSVIRTQVDVVLPEGTAVLNATDERVADLAPLCDGEVIFYGPAGLARIASHVEDGGRALCLRDGRLEFLHGARRETVWLPPAALVPGNVLLAAAGAAWACGLAPQAIAAGLGSFDAAGSTAVRVSDLVQAWSHHSTVQSRNAVNGNHPDPVLARPQSVELAHACGSDAALPRI